MLWNVTLSSERGDVVEQIFADRFEVHGGALVLVREQRELSGMTHSPRNVRAFGAGEWRSIEVAK